MRKSTVANFKELFRSSLASYLEVNKLTAAELAKLLHRKTGRTVQRWLAGTSVPSEVQLLSICQKLNWDYSKFLVSAHTSQILTDHFLALASIQSFFQQEYDRQNTFSAYSMVGIAAVRVLTYLRQQGLAASLHMGTQVANGSTQLRLSDPDGASLAIVFHLTSTGILYGLVEASNVLTHLRYLDEDDLQRFTTDLRLRFTQQYVEIKRSAHRVAAPGSAATDGETE